MSIMYKVCKRTIERGNYPEDMAMRINVFYGAGLINTEEYNILVGMLSN
jgi:hypothetical protein